MSIIVPCSDCGRKLKAPDSYVGRKAKCSHCGAVVIVQISTEMPAASVPKPAAPRRRDEQPLASPKTRRQQKRATDQPLRHAVPEPEEADVVDAEIVKVESAEVEGDEAEPAEPVEAPRPRKKRKKKQRGKKSNAAPSRAALWWTIGLGGAAALATTSVVITITAGYGLALLGIGIAMAILVPISVVILIVSMFASSALAGGIDFGEAQVVIPKAVGLLLVINLISLIPFGFFLALPIWLFGLMALFHLDLWEARFLISINWILNMLAKIFLLALILSIFSHTGADDRDIDPSPSPEQMHQPANAQEAKDMRAIDALGGHYQEEPLIPGSPITQISLSDTLATNNDLEIVERFPKLQRLFLSSTKITDEGLVHLRGLPGLRMLDLSHTRVTDEGLEHLKELRLLRVLILTRTRVTDAGIEDLRKALPGCTITTQPEPAEKDDG